VSTTNDAAARPAPETEPAAEVDLTPAALSRRNVGGGFLRDRLNPILVREVQQALTGRMFLGSLVVCLAVTLIFGLVVAIDGQGAAGHGRDYFEIAVAILAPLVLFVVPIQGFTSMRSELQPGTVEQLLMSRLRPGQIVRGKILASMVQYLLFGAVFAPLMSTLYMLQGLDLPTIGLSLLFSLVACFTATTAAIAAASLARLGPLQPLAYAGVAFGLGSLSLATSMGAGEAVRRMGDLLRHRFVWSILETTGLVVLFGTVLCGMIAASQLTHEHENRSTGFRVLAVIGAVVALFWAWFVMPSSPLALPTLVAVWPGVGMGIVGAAAAFGLFAITENASLSPRVAAHVPRRTIWALLAAPWLPGSGRGTLFVLGLLLLALAGGAGLPWLVFGEVHRGSLKALLLVAGYTWIYLGLTGVVRDLFGRRRQAVAFARMMGPLLLVLGCTLPPILELALSREPRDWHWGYITNPFFSFHHAMRTGTWSVVVAVGCGALAVFGLRFPAMVRGVTDVVRAARRRREAHAA